MAFEKELPQWKEKGVKPPQSKLDEGWKVQDKPPAAWLNWQMNKTYEALKEVREKAAEKEHVQAAKITRDDGTAQIAPDRDINKWNKLGVYSFNEAHISTPSGFVRGLIFVYEDEVGITYQMAWEKDSRLAVRTKNEVGKWNEWGGMVASDELEKILAGYMHKTGGDFDGSVGFPGYGSIMKFTHGTGDNATYDVYNNALRVHWGLAMKTYDESVTGMWDSRTGRWITKGGFSVQRGSGNEKWNVDPSGSQTMDGSLNVKGGATIQGDGPVLTLKGTTHQYINFFAKQSGNRSGYIGASDPNNPGNVAVVSDGGFLVLKGTQGVMVNDRNILIELDQLKQSGVDAKNRIAGAINAKGVPASANDDFSTLASKIGQIKTETPPIIQPIDFQRSNSRTVQEDWQVDTWQTTIATVNMKSFLAFSGGLHVENEPDLNADYNQAGVRILFKDQHGVEEQIISAAYSRTRRYESNDHPIIIGRSYKATEYIYNDPNSEWPKGKWLDFKSTFDINGPVSIVAEFSFRKPYKYSYSATLKASAIGTLVYY
ncbi:hypothetical protein ABN764_10605 [Paenibacillaceae sp. P-4]|uniref:hypothetical protein n=1 Tax=Paenibacillaceae bacterium P-4 TaxID=3160969 RepID=UPI0032E819C3